MTSLTQKRNQTRHAFLLTFFSKEERYQVREMNGFILVKQWNGATKSWEVAIHTPQSYRTAQTYLQATRPPEAERTP